MFLDAEMTQTHAKSCGRGIEPVEHTKEIPGQRPERDRITSSAR
jgi:hypothetical protein